MKAFLENKLSGKKVLILGVGIEGQSSYRMLREFFPTMPLAIADQRVELPNPGLWQHPLTSIRTGFAYLEGLADYDLVIKSPGISMETLHDCLQPRQLTSQTALFLEAYRSKVIGITGTKGKTTTSHLVHHVLKTAGMDALLVGNMGLPPFEVVGRIGDHTQVVFELSSHQLENLTVSPHIAVLLNIYQEHLDHYASYKHYQLAKFNIARHQQEGDWFIYAGEDARIATLVNEIPIKSNKVPYGFDLSANGLVFSKDQVLYTRKKGKPYMVCDQRPLTMLPGRHNQLNMMAAVAVCLLKGIKPEIIGKAAASFKALPHRLEKLGEIGGKIFYNDSIATIPEAAIVAVAALQGVDCMILGGHDRGIDYSEFVRFLGESNIPHFVFTGLAGLRIFEALLAGYSCWERCSFFDKFDDAVRAAIEKTAPGKICLLSPAASSYDQFKNFEHRGNRFREIVKEIHLPQ
ncbi:MAG: UDP-N-acetylmuramoyl-L-alanine--D-glutamate ligase [Bacteroidales bacterium]|nr:UDP-N-acetylmuramoyl-L-alanine--D-glutamate ligase [Bacteroidales bacterium]MDZ4203742.1 UDP-N-acetylmuramoyl-L-alanine--D-glutamate ligase [Bacteroidales bacterium]